MTLPVGSAANSSLGAVGGARGTAAGAIRILVEFLTQYDSKAVKQLEADLASLEAGETSALSRQISAEKALNTSRQRRLETEKELRRLVSLQEKPGTIRRELKEIQNIGVLSKEGQRRLKDLDRELGLNGQLVRLQTQQAKLKATEAGFTTRVKNDTAALNIQAEQRLATEKQLSRFQQLKAAVPGKLAGLALGAVGGIVGGAILGVGFAAAEAALEAIANGLKDIFDPARHAREALKEVGGAINQIALQEENSGDRQKATLQYLRDLGIEADEATVKLLAQAAATQTGREALDAHVQVSEIAKHSETLANQLRKDTIDRLIKEARVRGDLVSVTYRTAKGIIVAADTTYYAARAEEFLAQATNRGAEAADRAAAEAANLEAARRQQAGAAQLAAFAEQNLASILQSTAAAKSAGFDAQISALRDGAQPSARTKNLERQIEALQGGGGSNNSTELRNIAEERALILLRQKLRLLGANIDLEKYSGKFLLEAINAKQKALQKEADAQDRLNKLLDLQFKMSQVIRRNEGETISDFLERRAQENRDMLSEQRDLERDAVLARLEELEEKTQDEVALQELAERKKNALSKGGTDNRIKNLQKELEASRDADRKALQAKIDAIEKQKKAYEDLASTAEKYATQQANDQIREALRAARSVEELAKLSGQASGLAAAYSFISSLLTSGAVTGSDAAFLRESLGRISKTLELLDARMLQVGKNKIRHFAAGGLINLSNASSPFGSNVRFGEEGSESALILQHKVAEGLKKSMKSVDQIGPFYMDRSDNQLRDRWEMKKLVREAVAEALG